MGPCTYLLIRLMLLVEQIAILNGASIFGRTILNMLADRVGPLNVLWPVAAVTAALIFVMFSVTSTGATIVFSIFYGFFSGACTFIPYTCYHHLPIDASCTCSDINDATHSVALCKWHARDGVSIVLWRWPSPTSQ